RSLPQRWRRPPRKYLKRWRASRCPPFATRLDRTDSAKDSTLPAPLRSAHWQPPSAARPPQCPAGVPVDPKAIPRPAWAAPHSALARRHENPAPAAPPEPQSHPQTVFSVAAAASIPFASDSAASLLVPRPSRKPRRLDDA